LKIILIVPNFNSKKNELKKNKFDLKMGIYECIYDCGDENYCVSCFSLDDCPPGWAYICKKHQLIIGNKFKYDLKDFILKHKKK